MMTGRWRANRSDGRADPFGLLIIVVMLALSLTMLVQAQASSPIDFSWPTSVKVWPLADRG